MKVIYNKLIPFKGFSAINILGILFAREDAEIGEKLIRHEKIHTKQQKELLWILFYVWYFVEWTIRVLLSKDRFTKNAYFNISFEREAYENQYDAEYVESRKHYAWIKYYKNN